MTNRSIIYGVTASELKWLAARVQPGEEVDATLSKDRAAQLRTYREYMGSGQLTLGYTARMLDMHPDTLLRRLQRSGAKPVGVLRSTAEKPRKGNPQHLWAREDIEGVL